MAEMIPHWLLKQADYKGGSIAIEMPGGKKVTFSEMEAESIMFARKLAALGVKKGDHIGILSANSLEMTYAIHAMSLLGTIGVLLNTRLTDNEINYQLQDAEVSFLITDKEQSGRNLDTEKMYTFTEIDEQPESDIVLQKEINLIDPFTIIYTSGTTGFPKGVVHTYGNHWWSSISSALNLGLDKTDKWLISLPLFHVSGLSTLLKSAIYGMPVYLMKNFDEDVVYHALTEEHVTIMSVVSVMLQRLEERFESDDFPSRFRCFLLGGGPVSESLLARTKEKGMPVVQSYGMTETTSQIATLSAEDAIRKIGSAGKPLLPASLKIDELEAEDGVGEIIVKGPMVTKGYYKNTEANEKSIIDGWLHTGDLGYLDEEGYLYVVDRRSDLIISGGENIYPAEVENALLTIPNIKEAAVGGMKDETWGEVPVAYVVLKSPITTEEIIEHVKGSLAKIKIPKRIHFVDQLPRNASNKIMRNKLKDLDLNP